MLQTMSSTTRNNGCTLRIGIGVAEGPEPLAAVLTACTTARADIGGASPHLAVVVTTAYPGADLSCAVRSVLGPVGITGGVTAGLLTEQGVITNGALVLCVSDADGGTSGVAARHGRNLADAAQASARLVLAGWPFRGRYPRGIGFAFAGQGSGAPATDFLASWRELMGPKMRTVCGVMTTPHLFGGSSADLLASVGCLEAPYAMGLGLAEGSPDAAPDADMLIHGSVEAARTALKWLEDQPARLVVALESVARFRALGAAASREWASIREQVHQHDGTSKVCVGWLCDEVAAYGRGVHPVAAPGALVVTALGDVARDGERL
jgi:hypothetical protein